MLFVLMVIKLSLTKDIGDRIIILLKYTHAITLLPVSPNMKINVLLDMEGIYANPALNIKTIGIQERDLVSVLNVYLIRLTH